MIGIIKSCYGICIVSIGIMLFHAPPASSQTVIGGQNGKTQQVPEVGNEPKNTASKVISEKLEKARQKYLKALTAIENDDTLSIPRLFEDAVQALNSLASYPGIESNEDFADLAQSIIDDYESYVQIIDSLPESSSAFMLRNKIYQEVEDIDPASPSMSTMQFTSTRVSGAPGVPGMTIPLDINEYVQKNITFLSQDKGRKFFKRWIEKSTRWFPLLKRIAREEDMPEDIIYLSMIESALNPNAVSWAKAVGMWQFMQAAASDYGLTMNSWVDERRDPEKSTRAAMRYLKWLYNEFGDWHLALAAYNSGPNGPVRRGISRIQKDAPTFWDIREYLPKETKNYVPLYIATAVICLNQEQYGFTKDELTFEPEYQYETHPIDGSISLKVIAQCLNESIEQVKELNPELVGTTTPPNSDEPYELKIPVGKKELFAQNLAKLTPEELNPWVLHSVEKGETIADIAAKYAVNTLDITSNNSISSGSKLKKGMSIRIPREALGTAVLTANTPSSDTISGSVSTIEQPAKNSVVESNQQQATVASQVETPINTTVPKKNTEQNDLLVNASPSIATNQEKVVDKKTPKEEISETEKPTAISVSSQQTRKSQITEQKDQVEIETKKSARAHVKHIVRSGESLYTLAQKYGVRMTDLRNWNGISFDTDQLTEGQELIVSSTASPKLVYIQEQKHKSPTQTVKRGNKHTVKRGETLAQIADDYGIDIESLRKANNIKKSGTIRSGTILRIPKQSFSDERSTRAVSKKRTSGSTLKVHSLKKGETLSKIAALYNVSEKDLRSWNPGIKASKVVRGQKIKVYSKVSGKGSSSESKNRSSSRLPKQYKVKKGDSMKSIAGKFGISLSQLKKKNKKSKSGLKAGQTLRIQ